MDPRANPATAFPEAREPLEGGFTFLEIMVVMGLMAVLLGLGMGFLTGVGKASLTQQAVAILAESGQRCLNQSAGAKQATLELRKAKMPDGNERLQVRTAVQRTVLTANFEVAPPNRPDLDWFVFANGPEAAKPTGNVKLDAMGKSGSSVDLQGGGYVDFGTRSAFAMTDGLAVDVWVRPASTARGNMTIVKSEGDGTTLWALQLARDIGGGDNFRVVLKLTLVSSDAVEGASPSGSTVYQTKTAAVAANVWSRIQVSFDGVEPVLRVDGVDRYEPEKRSVRMGPDGLPVSMRLFVPPSGVAHLTLSDPSAPFIGWADTLNVSGIFRNDEDERWLPFGVEVYRTPLPVRISFANGRLDPALHNRDVEVRIVGPASQENGGWEVVRFGLYGNIPPPRHVVPVAGP